MFKPVGSRVSFPQLEEEILRFWQEKSIFEKSVESREGKPRFVFYEGPPFANGNPGIHHVLARAYKDVIVRYKVMKGYYAPRIAGWDTHGLPVELEVEKQLGFSGKDQIEKYGIEEFNKRSKESVFKYLKEWNTLTERIAYWVDLDHAYKTMDNSYIESVWWALKQMWDKGLIYQGYKVTPHCPRCGTSLSSHEVALGYQDDTEDPSVYVKFKTNLSVGKDNEINNKLFNLASTTDTYLLAWTTTPWTLPGNTALAVSPEAVYALVEAGSEYLLLAEARLIPAGLGENRILMKVKGSYLVGAEYDPLFNPHEFGVERLKPKTFVDRDVTQMRRVFEPQESVSTLTYRVIDAEFVSMEDGTGIVHIAPAFGEDDFKAGMENDLNFVQPVDLQGKIIGTYPFAGKFVKQADPLIIEDLKNRNLLFRSETIRHTYPFCWRCSTPLLYYAKDTWYIRTTAVKDRLIAGNEEINWYPGHIKYGRFGDWLQNNVDWAFSRERYWGTPLPVWRCEKCGSFECLGGVAELKAKPGFSGLREPLDLHRPFVDEATFNCAKCGGLMKRQPEVMDCWLDSGSMPFAQLHYPFENKSLFEQEMKQADYICEGIDQTRGWFYSLHAVSTLLFDRPSFRNCICLELVLDAKGKKMSKSRGNVVDPMQVVMQHGADALRWYCFTAAPPGMVRRFDTKMVAEITRQVFLTLWNVYSFFITYANIDKFTPSAEQPKGEPPELDRWITSKLNQLIADVDAAMDGYDPTEAGRKIEGFIDELSNWYVRRSRRRFWKPALRGLEGSENDADKLSAHTTLYNCLVTLAKLLAPLAPYLAEELYQNLVCSVSPDAPESVHLADFPVADTSKIDQQLTDDIHLAMRISSLGRAARSAAKIKVRQPLAINYVGLPSISEQLEASLRRIMPQVLDELNIKEMKWDTFENVAALGKEKFVVVSEATCNVAAPIGFSLELQAEGMAREIVHRLQTMRRSAGFDIADHIVTYYQGDDYTKHVLKDFADYVKQETLSRELVDGVPEQDVFTERFKLEGHEMALGVKKAG